VGAARARLRDLRGRATAPGLTGAIDSLDRSLASLVGERAGGRGRGGATGQSSLRSVGTELLAMLALLEEADVEPTTQAMTAVRSAEREFGVLISRWSHIETTEVAALNVRLRAAGLSPIVVE
jgi:hypothetical protein